jgi:hypothetical protein
MQGLTAFTRLVTVTRDQVQGGFCGLGLSCPLRRHVMTVRTIAGERIAVVALEQSRLRSR